MSPGEQPTSAPASTGRVGTTPIRSVRQELGLPVHRSSVEPLRIAVVGQGLIGRQRAEAVVELGATLPVELAATVDPFTTAGFPVPHLRDAEELASVDFDACVVSVPHDQIAPVVASITEMGRPVLVEKPLGLSLTEAEAIVARTSLLDQPSFVGYNYRFLPTLQHAVRSVASGELGRIRGIDLLLAHGGHPDSGESWKLQPERAGGGVLIDPGTHLIDLMLFLAPAVHLESVGATSGFWPTGIEEDLVATFSGDQLVATVRVSHIRWVNTFRIEVFGEDGYAMIDGRGATYGSQTLRIGRRWAWRNDEGKSQRETEEFYDFGPGNRSLVDELDAVARRWLGEPVPTGFPRPATMLEGLKVARLCDEMYRRLERRAIAA